MAEEKYNPLDIARYVNSRFITECTSYSVDSDGRLHCVNIATGQEEKRYEGERVEALIAANDFANSFASNVNQDKGNPDGKKESMRDRIIKNGRKPEEGLKLLVLFAPTAEEPDRIKGFTTGSVIRIDS